MSAGHGVAEDRAIERSPGVNDEHAAVATLVDALPHQSDVLETTHGADDARKRAPSTEALKLRAAGRYAVVRIAKVGCLEGSHRRLRADR